MSLRMPIYCQATYQTGYLRIQQCLETPVAVSAAPVGVTRHIGTDSLNAICSGNTCLAGLELLFRKPRFFVFLNEKPQIGF